MFRRGSERGSTWRYVEGMSAVWLELKLPPAPPAEIAGPNAGRRGAPSGVRTRVDVAQRMMSILIQLAVLQPVQVVHPFRHCCKSDPRDALIILVQGIYKISLNSFIQAFLEI